MFLATLPFAYLGWHYTLALRDFWTNARNLIVFLARFFSIKILLKTFFAPWRRLGEGYKKGFYPGAWLETFILNTLMRVVGVLFRFWIILAGLLVLILAIILTILAFCLWLILPILLAILFIVGLTFFLR